MSDQNEYDGYDQPPVPQPGGSGSGDDEQPQPAAQVGRGRGRGGGGRPGRVAPRSLPRRTVRNRRLVGMPKTVDKDGEEVQYESEDDGDFVDEEINEAALLDPEEELLVDIHGRPIVFPFTDAELQPQNATTKALTAAIKSKYQFPYLNWTEVRKDPRGWSQFWQGFREQLTWDRKHTAKVKAIFDKKASKRLSSMLMEVRKKLAAEPVTEDEPRNPSWIVGDTWSTLLQKWTTEDYKAQCEKAKKNRSSDKGGCVHAGGSSSASTLRIRFEKEHGRPPTLLEMNDLMHKYEDGTWTGERVEQIADKVRQFVEAYDAHQQSLPPQQREPPSVRQSKITKAFVDASGGKRRGRTFAAGSTSSLYRKDPTGYMDTGTSSSISSQGCRSTGRSAAPQRREVDDDEINARVAAKVAEEMAARMREYDARFESMQQQMMMMQQGQPWPQGQAGWQQPQMPFQAGAVPWQQQPLPQQGQPWQQQQPTGGWQQQQQQPLQGHWQQGQLWQQQQSWQQGSYSSQPAQQAVPSTQQAAPSTHQAGPSTQQGPSPSSQRRRQSNVVRPQPYHAGPSTAQEGYVPDMSHIQAQGQLFLDLNEALQADDLNIDIHDYDITVDGTEGIFFQSTPPMPSGGRRTSGGRGSLPTTQPGGFASYAGGAGFQNYGSFFDTPPRQSLPPLQINEGGRSGGRRSAGRRGRGLGPNDRGKQVYDGQPEDEEDD